LVIDLIPQTEGQVQGNVDEASDVLGSLGVSTHPKNRICYAREHGAVPPLQILCGSECSTRC
jgi:hypothetical protein